MSNLNRCFYQELDKINGIEVNIYLSNSNTIRE